MHSYTLNEVFHMAAIRASKKSALGASKFAALRAMHFPFSTAEVSNLGFPDCFMCNQKFTTLNLLVAKCLSVSKKYYFLRRDDLADAVWKGRMLCTGNCIKGGDGKMVWNMDALYAAPVDLHNACLVVLYGALHGVFWQADVKSAYLQPARGGNVAWLRLPAFLVDFDFDFAPACPKAALFGAQAM